MYLEKLKDACEKTQSPYINCYAARELSKWYLDRTDLDSLDIAERYSLLASQVAVSKPEVIKSNLLRIICAQRKKRRNLSASLIDDLRERNIFSPDIVLSLASLRNSGLSKIRLVNQALSYYLATPVSLLDNNKRDLFDSLCGDSSPSQSSRHDPIVSVLIATYNSSGRLETALRSLQSQSWGNCEFIIIDDASPNSLDKEIAQHFVCHDQRFKYIRTPTNGGAYVARNFGLQYAAGEFVTLHDSDDWSHPQKIETQVRFILANPSIIGCTSQQARCSPSLCFDDIRSNDLLIFLNTSSFLWRRKPVIDSLGCWDTVRFGADSELIRRIKHQFGDSCVVNLETGPLSFQRKHETNVTSNRYTGLSTLYCGARKEYAESSKYFLAHCNSVFYAQDTADNRCFPAPLMMLPSDRQSASSVEYDIVLFCDIFTDSPDLERSLDYINRLELCSLRIALIPIVSNLRILNSLNIDQSIRKLCHHQKIYIAVYGETIYAKKTVKLSSVPPDYPHKANVVNVVSGE